MLRLSKTLTAGLFGILIITGICWKNKPVTSIDYNLCDTVPGEKDWNDHEPVINGDLEKALEQVRKAQLQLDKQLQTHVVEKMQAEINKAQSQISSAMKNIDWQKIQQGMKEVDLQKMQQQIEKAQRDIEGSVNQKEIQEQMDHAMENAKHAVAKLETLDLNKLAQQMQVQREQLENNQADLQKQLGHLNKDLQEQMSRLPEQLEKAKNGVAKVQQDLEAYRDMVQEMHADGLIKSTDNYTIKYKKGELFIDGVKQPDSVVNKYKHHLKQDPITIERNQNDEHTIHL